MNFKYYDILSSLVMGYVLLVIGMYSFQFDYNNDYTVAYLAIAFLCGYIINSIGSLLEPIYYFTIGGKPSSRLLDENKKKHNRLYHFFIPRNTGIEKVRFYETADVRKLLINKFEEENVTDDRLFCEAMRTVSSSQDSRVQEFNAHYALSRSILTMVLISTIFIIATNPSCWQSYISIVVVLICWNRYKERAYYYAREVLNEYLKETKK